jgi:hypothetical protein
LLFIFVFSTVCILKRLQRRKIARPSANFCSFEKFWLAILLGIGAGAGAGAGAVIKFLPDAGKVTLLDSMFNIFTIQILLHQIISKFYKRFTNLAYFLETCVCHENYGK